MSPDNLYNQKELLLRIAEGDDDAFNKLVHIYGAQIYPYLLKFTRSAEIAEDLSQDIFLKIWLCRNQLPSLSNVNTWIFTIAANVARSWLRKKIRERELLNNTSLQQPTDEEMHYLELKEIRSLLHNAIQSLHPRQQQIYIMHRVENKKQVEIAEELNISLSTVKNTLSAAQEQIRGYLKLYGKLIVWLFLYWGAYIFFITQ